MVPLLIEDVHVDHGRADVLVFQQFLNCSDIVTALEQRGGKECRKVRHVARLAKPAFLTAPSAAFWVIDL